MIVLELKHSEFTSEEECKRFAKRLSNTLEAREEKGLPYKPNDNDWRFWTLDGGNDWKVKFFHENVNAFGIIYRYNCEANPYEEAFVEFLKVRYHNVGIIEEPAY